MRSGCPLNYGLEIFGDKWSLLIIRDMMFFGKRYYREFLTSDEGISTNILADRLALLEREGIIAKRQDGNHKQKLIYSLTEKGIDLVPIIGEIGLWSDHYANNLHEKRDLILGRFKGDKVSRITELKDQLRVEHIIQKKIDDRKE